MKRRRLKTSRLIPLAVLVSLILAQRFGLFHLPRREEPETSQQPHACQLVRVVDGDTIVVRWRGKTEHVRLLHVNTPERGQPGYEQSADFLRGLLGEKAIQLEFENRLPAPRDGYGRLLAYVFADSQNVNVAIVCAGWSPYWTKYGRGKYADAFEQAQADAKRNGRGLWGKQKLSDDVEDTSKSSDQPRLERAVCPVSCMLSPVFFRQ